MANFVASNNGYGTIGVPGGRTFVTAGVLIAGEGGEGPPPPEPGVGYIKYWTGSAWVEKPVKFWNGSAWVQKPVKFWNGSAWVLG